MFVPYHLFIKLGNIHDRDGNSLDGEETMRIYHRYQKDHEFFWWGVGSLPKGMSPKRVAQIEAAVKDGQRIYVYFLIHNQTYDNEIVYRAVLQQVVSSKVKCQMPSRDGPSCFGKEKAGCWLKLSELTDYPGRQTSDFVIASTGRDLYWAVTHSQYKFGYIEEK